MSNQSVEKLKEKLAAIEHQRWSDWQSWVFKNCQLDTDKDGKVLAYAIPIELAKRWQKQIDTPYEKLSRKEQESDLKEVERYWPLIEKLIDQAQQEARINELEWVQAEGGKTNHCDSRELQLRKKLVINRLSELEGRKT